MIKRKKDEQFAVRFDSEYSSRIKNYASTNDMSKAAVVRKAIKEFFERIPDVNVIDT